MKFNITFFLLNILIYIKKINNKLLVVIFKNKIYNKITLYDYLFIFFFLFPKEKEKEKEK